MKITRGKSSSAYHLYIYLALRETVKGYEQVAQEITNCPELTEETATPQLTRLYYLRKQKAATVVVLAASCVEALGNLYLALKTTPEQFKTLERTNLIDKWVVLPSLFLPGYIFPKGEQLYCDLRQLCKQRDSLMHLKEEITQGEEVVHKGNLPEAAGDEHAFLGRCAILPIKLVQHLANYDSTETIRHMQFCLTFGFAFSEWPEALGGDDMDAAK